MFFICFKFILELLCVLSEDIRLLFMLDSFVISYDVND